MKERYGYIGKNKIMGGVYRANNDSIFIRAGSYVVSDDQDQTWSVYEHAFRLSLIHICPMTETEQW